MNRLERIQQLNQILLTELPQFQKAAEGYPQDERAQRQLLRALMNVRPPMPISEEFLQMQDELLSAETQEKGIVDVNSLPNTDDERLVLWQGDITRLNADVIVNAANDALLGCFVPGHHCIDNAIHSASGMQLRLACDEIMQAQGHPEPTGRAKITPAFNLPSKYVLHTVGPIIYGAVSKNDRDLLASCYHACLQLASDERLESVAFCCISTGEFRFPNQEAAEVAVQTVKEFLNENNQIKKVIFNVFKDKDTAIYRELFR